MEYLIFPCNDPGLSEGDLILAQEQSELYFNTAADASQIEIGADSRRWVKANIPECWRIIKCGSEVAGHAFMLPCRAELMRRFIQGSISESELFAAVRAEPIDYACVYFGSLFLDERHRGKGLAARAVLESIEYITKHKNPRPELFYWEYSPEGAALAERLEGLLRKQGESLPVRVRRTAD
jgi:GNAT superfamily N-acetyltransferase